jgi:hypothetical protein
LDGRFNVVRIFDNPKVITQLFEVASDEGGSIFVRRTETIRGLHNMGCTDGLPNGHIDRRVEYNVFKEVDQKSRMLAIEAVEKSIENVEKKHGR